MFLYLPFLLDQVKPLLLSTGSIVALSLCGVTNAIVKGRVLQFLQNCISREVLILGCVFH